MSVPFAINLISIITVLVSIAKYWYLGYGNKRVRAVCEWQIIGSLLQMVYNALIVSRDPALWGSTLYQPVLLWGLVMSVKGWRNAE